MKKYEAVIGLEVHIQVRTNSKMFCSCANQYGGEPNTVVCPVCMGYPGVMPVPNKEAIKKIVKAGLMCGCDIPNYSKFDRKSYFYPDMPKNYQITQFDLPFCLNGAVKLLGEGYTGQDLTDRVIGLTRIHLEEDVAKSTHFGGYSGIDYNRAGVPLMEIVSEPDMETADEAYAYLTEIRQIMQYAGISDCDMEKGQMRCDVNISLRKVGTKPFGTKIEIKNLNSRKAVHGSIEHEMIRQAEELDNGVVLQQETRGWNDERGETYLMRIKEDAHDYRYFPEPDLMPVDLSDEFISSIKDSLPELPEATRLRFVETYKLTAYDAEVLTTEKALANYFDAGAKLSKQPKLLANWMISELLRELSDAHIAIAKCAITPENFADLVNLIDKGTISGKIAKKVFAKMFKTGKEASLIVKEDGLVQVSDESAIDAFVDEAIEKNSPQVEQYKSGKKEVLQYFVGQVMKLSRGKANPQVVVKLLKSKLD